MATLSTHVLDTAAGRPAVGVPVTLLDDAGTTLADGITDADGRVGSLGGELATGTYRLRFAVDGPFYPEVVVTFTVAADEHHHLVDLSPFGVANDGEVFIAADRPYGLIEATVVRDDT